MKIFDSSFFSPYSFKRLKTFKLVKSFQKRAKITAKPVNIVIYQFNAKQTPRAAAAAAHASTIYSVFYVLRINTFIQSLSKTYKMLSGLFLNFLIKILGSKTVSRNK